MRIPGQLLGNLFWAMGASITLAAPARAEGGDAAGSSNTSLWLSLPSCATPPYQQAELEHALDVELGARGLRSRLASKAGSVSGPRVMLSLSSCEPDADSITLQISTQRGHALADRRIELRAIEPRARARTVALLIVDALEPPRLPGGEEVEAEAPAEGAASLAAPQVTLVPPRAALAPSGLDELLLERKDPYPSPFGLHLGVAGHAHVITRGSNALFGAQLSGGGRISRRSEWALEAAYAGGFASTSVQDYHLQWYGAALGGNLIVSESPRLGLGPRVGIARVIGSSRDNLGEVALDGATLVTLGARMDLSAPVSQYLSLQLGVEASDHVLQRFDTAEAEELPLYGMILSWGIGVEFTL